MRERGAFGFLGIILLLTILFFATEEERTELNGAHNGRLPVVMINGRPFESNFIVQGDEGRVVVVVDQDDLFVGENTVELRWGSAPSSTMTADLPSESQQH